MAAIFPVVLLISIALFFWAVVKRLPTAAVIYPPISDAEFVARCSPGTSPEVALKVRRIVAEFFGVEYERVHPSTRFFEDLAAY